MKNFSKENYLQKIEELKLKTTSDIQFARERFQEFTHNYPHKYMHGAQNENSTGDYLNNTQNCHFCFNVNEAQDCKFVFDSRRTKKVYDMTVFGSLKGAEFCYENHEIGDGARNICFGDQIWTGVYNIFYSKLCINNCHDLFGCVGLKHQQYCIFNKKYEKEEYENLRARIIEHMKKTSAVAGQAGEWGEYFPSSISPFCYNETTAQNYYPLSKKDAITLGYKWKDIDMRENKPQSYTIQDLIEDVPDTIINEILACTECKKNYKIIDEELKFYKRIKLPVPEKCPDCRQKYRFKLRNPRKLHNRNCQKCNIEIKTTYSPDRPEIIYCEKCYQEAIE